MRERIRFDVHAVGAAVLVAACGGTSVKHDEATAGDGGDSGSAGVAGLGGSGPGGSPSGGTAGAGGSMGALGGSPTGGTIGATGGVSGGAAGGLAGEATGGFAGAMAGFSGSSGGAPDHPLLDCLRPIESGTCTAVFERFAFNQVTLACEPFAWGGCGGNENRFESLEECEAACVAALPKDCTPDSRGPGCPCGPNIGPCSLTSCSSAAYELGFPCQPSDVMLCSRGGAKGGCWCPPETGDVRCGV